jgi:hypothetical protein
MAQSNELLLLTHHGTVLFEQNGLLVHRSLLTFVPNLLFHREGDELKTELLSQRPGVTIKTIDGEDAVYIECALGCLCANVDGHTLWQGHLATWEKFTPIPLAEALARKAELSQVDAQLYFRRYHRKRIPSIIHQTGNSVAVPEAARTNVTILRTLNPHWEYKYYNDEHVIDFIRREFGFEILKCYLSINPRYGATRADLFRYLCIYHFGGVYLDMKSCCEDPLDSIIRDDDEYLLSYWQNAIGAHPELPFSPRGEFQQWHVIAMPGHPFLQEVIKNVLINIRTYTEELFGVGRRAGVTLTGPVVYTKSIYPLLGDFKHRFFEAQREGFLYESGSRHDRVGLHYSKQNTPAVL